jgi:hypothetical protein
MYDNIHRHGLTEQEQHNWLTAIGEFVRASIKEAVEPRDKRIAELEARIATLESKGIKFAGTYQRACEYGRGDVVNCDGAMWVCIAALYRMKHQVKAIAGNSRSKVRGRQRNHGHCTTTQPPKDGHEVSQHVRI